MPKQTKKQIQACKFPRHRDLLGYKTAPALDHPERLWARRGKRLYLNIIDAPDPNVSLGRVMDAGLAAVAAGGDDAAVALAVKAAVDRVKVA